MPIDRQQDYDLETRKLDFIVLGGIAVRVQEFVDIWNGQNILPTLSRSEYDAESSLGRRDGLILYPGDDDPLFYRAVDAVKNTVAMIKGETDDLSTLSRVRAEKRKKILKMIETYKTSGHNVGMLQMDRVLDVLSDGQMEYDDISRFIARYSEPDAANVSIIQEATAEVTALAPGVNHRTRQVNRKSAQSLETLPEDQQNNLLDLLKTQQVLHPLIPIILLERAMVAQKLTPDELDQLTLYKNFGSPKVMENINLTRQAIFALGLLMSAAAMHSVPKDSDAFYAMLYAGLGLASLSAATVLLPKRALKIELQKKDSNKFYQRLYDKLVGKVEQLKKTPAGKVRLMFLREMIRSNHDPRAEKNVKKLYNYAQAFQWDMNLQEEFNNAFGGIDRDWETVEGVLQSIEEFESVKRETGGKWAELEAKAVAGELGAGGNRGAVGVGAVENGVEVMAEATKKRVVAEKKPGARVEPRMEEFVGNPEEAAGSEAGVEGEEDDEETGGDAQANITRRL